MLGIKLKVGVKTHDISAQDFVCNGSLPEPPFISLSCPKLRQIAVNSPHHKAEALQPRAVAGGEHVDGAVRQQQRAQRRRVQRQPHAAAAQQVHHRHRWRVERHLALHPARTRVRALAQIEDACGTRLDPAQAEGPMFLIVHGLQHVIPNHTRLVTGWLLVSGVKRKVHPITAASALVLNIASGVQKGQWQAMRSRRVLSDDDAWGVDYEPDGRMRQRFEHTQ